VRERDMKNKIKNKFRLIERKSKRINSRMSIFGLVKMPKFSFALARI